MCTGAELALASQIATGVGTAVSVLGTIRGSQQQAGAARFQQALALQRADRERELASRAAEDQRRAGSRLAATQRARLAAAGVVPGTGTALLLETDLAAETEFQALLAKAGGDTQAQSSESEAKVFGRNARTAIASGRFRAGTTLLSGAVTAFRK